MVVWVKVLRPAIVQADFALCEASTDHPEAWRLTADSLYFLLIDRPILRTVLQNGRLLGSQRSYLA
jgi:hypothetical protein